MSRLCGLSTALSVICIVAMSVSCNKPISPNVAATVNGRPITYSELDRAIAQLPEEQRQVLLLVGLEGMDYQETAAVLKIPVGTVRSRLSRGRDLLRKLMGVEKRPSQVGRPKRSVRSLAMAA